MGVGDQGAGQEDEDMAGELRHSRNGGGGLRRRGIVPPRRRSRRGWGPAQLPGAGGVAPPPGQLQRGGRPDGGSFAGIVYFGGRRAAADGRRRVGSVRVATGSGRAVAEPNPGDQRDADGFAERVDGIGGSAVARRGEPIRRRRFDGFGWGGDRRL
ncbi:unnamed protein product [Linum tenue]|uniref:Uncharacterized protein n=1 Tax=Linum tenue TaxID=586396 RepID=A0AAV0RGS9_9ROSI|nr:unnamed protein product [Linum tenue]